MAKIVIAGDAIVVTSAMKLEDIKTIEKYRPNALTLMGSEDGKEPIFAIGTTEGCGNINQVNFLHRIRSRMPYPDIRPAYGV